MTDQTTDDIGEEEEPEEYNVEYTITIKGTLTATSQDEADSMADDMKMQITVSLPDQYVAGWDSIEEEDFEMTVESAAERAAADYAWRQRMAEAVEESASEPGD